MKKGWLQKQLNNSEEVVNSLPKWMRVDEKGNCMAIKPIRPSEVISKKKELLPDEVLEAFNELIAKEWDGREASFKLKEVVPLIAKKLNINSASVNSNWLDVEDIYRKAGWKVKYDGPGYCETYDAYYVFSKNK